MIPLASPSGRAGDVRAVSSPQISFPSAAGRVCTTERQRNMLIILNLMLFLIIVALIGKGRVATTIPPLYTEGYRTGWGCNWVICKVPPNPSHAMQSPLRSSSPTFNESTAKPCS